MSRSADFYKGGGNVRHCYVVFFDIRGGRNTRSFAGVSAHTCVGHVSGMMLVVVGL